MGGCLILPYKAEPATMASVGSINRDLLRPGTPRTSLTEMFGDSIVAAGPHLAWARTQFSNGGLAIEYIQFGSPNSDTRSWQTQNLMIEFDEQDRVRQYRVLDDSMLLPEVEKLLNDGSLDTPTFIAPVTLKFAAFDRSTLLPTTGRLTLSESGISWTRGKKAKAEAAPVALSNVRHRKTCPAPDTREPYRMKETLCASFDLQTSGMPIHLTARVTARDLFVLLAYARKFQHVGDPDN